MIKASIDILELIISYLNHLFSQNGAFVVQGHDKGVRGLQGHELRERVRRFGLCDVLEPAAERDEDEEHGRRVEEGHRRRVLGQDHRRYHHSHGILKPKKSP